MTNRRCPYCDKLPEYNHRDGVPVCKCSNRSCKGSERWLEYEEFEEQHLTIQRQYTSPAPTVKFIDWKWIELPQSLKDHHAFDILQTQLAAVGVKVRV